jgi:hypothetical protein
VTVTELRDEILSYTDNVDPGDSDNADRAARIVEYIRAVVADITFRRPWRYRQTRSSLLTLSSGSASLPADFIEFGPYGGVYHGTTGERLEEVDEQQIQEIRQRGGDNQRFVAVFGQDSTTGYQLVQMATTAALTLYVWYARGVPTLDTTTNNDKLKVAVPAQYHQLVILPGVQAKAQRSKGDARVREYLQNYEDGIRAMQRNEKRLRATTRHAPGFWASR